ncbi:uncharacterized protein PGTG_20931 [Puccinia graminis f. sp. tritici CRL 75-36-700-3]|uniref:GPN-loop GTPase 3 n=1 Tax=Puccinia graminis f. sp. tritici (strain CRL 75-36-700-3 / race SCCL) TaxID=418459 RepID=H6QPT3_PUCGT|nr:uncharacterized protein PGTG_20931 [Puccinia graminis f. sp. tritici CRL 75-36-700-3]EHS64320.1 hypothetical protein PGTG_20931 [Puccinia graminis f. sp. tritici CRL 75-36-700-3]
MESVVQQAFHEAGEFLAKIQLWSASIEDFIKIYSHPIKPYLPGLGRFLIVVIFYEDALRIGTQWEDQLCFLRKHRHFPWGLSHSFLVSNVVEQVNVDFLLGFRYLLKNLDWLEKKPKSCEDDFLIIDCPGQIELYTHFNVMHKIVQILTMEFDFRLCAVSH